MNKALSFQRHLIVHSDTQESIGGRMSCFLFRCWNLHLLFELNHFLDASGTLKSATTCLKKLFDPYRSSFGSTASSPADVSIVQASSQGINVSIVSSINILPTAHVKNTREVGGRLFVTNMPSAVFGWGDWQIFFVSNELGLERYKFALEYLFCVRVWYSQSCQHPFQPNISNTNATCWEPLLQSGTV